MCYRNLYLQCSRMVNPMRKLLFIFLVCLPAFAQLPQSACNGAAETGTVINSGTANNTVVYTKSASPVWGYSVQLTQTTTVTGGAVTFNLSNDGGATFTAVPVAQVLNVSTFAQLTNPYTLVASTNQSFLILMNGASNFQVKLTTAMTGSGTITPFVTAVCTAPPAFVLDSLGFLKINIAAQALGKVLVTPDSVALPANQSVNESQVNGVTPLMGNGVSGTGSQRVNIASDNSAVSGFGAGATGSAPPANAVLEGGLGSGATGGLVIAPTTGDTYKAINVASATTTLLVTGVSGRQVRITALHFIVSAADNVAFIEGTGATCGTGTAGMAGGTTAGSGYNLAANGGLALGDGRGVVMQTVTTGDSVCAVTSGSAQLSGGLEYAIN